jgi:uncharacterized protein (DUF1800 family)
MKFLNHPIRYLILLTLMFSTLPLSTAAGQKKQGLTEEQRILHVLNRLGFGPRPGDVARVKAVGLENYINQQLHPEKIADTIAENKVRDLTVLNMTTAELYEKYPQPGQLLRQLQARGVMPSETTAETPGNPLQNEKYREVLQKYYRENGLQQPQRIIAELQASRILRAVYSERQLHEVMVDFWTNHFNIFAGKGADRWLLPAYDRDTIRPHALGKFLPLLQATAQSPAMLFYLDNFQSVSPNMNRPGPRAQQQRRGINENYARELMELHTLGVDGGYTQKDVQEVARCFTGWTIFQPRGAGAALNPRLGEAGRRKAGTFFFNFRAHDDGEKTVLGHKIPAGGGIKDGMVVLEILARHPATAKFIATKLVRHFVADDPPAALIERAAAAFTKSDGDIRETLKTIFFSKEFNSPEAYRAKVKRPFELAVSAIRALGAETNGGVGTHQWIARMGEPLYGFQTPNGYSDAAESWVNTGGLLERMNFGLALANNRVPGTRVDLGRLTNGETSHANVLDQTLKTLLAGEISSATKEALLKQLSDSDPPEKVVGLLLGTPEFQRQ